MTDLVIRRLLVDLQTPFARHWTGDAFSTAFFNALSFSFPAGEQFFIDSVKLGSGQLAPAERLAFAEEMRGFIGQEATHRRVHELFNHQLAQQGLVNRWEGRILKRRQRLEGMDARAWVGATAATEHFTAVFADYLLAHPQRLTGAEPRLRDLWLWHSSEESEHRDTAFDLYHKLGGKEPWRKRLFWIISANFTVDLLRQTLHNLWSDGSWWRPATWAGAWRLLLAPGGLLRECFGPWRLYLAADFHPSQGDHSAGRRWLAENAALAPSL